MDSIFSKKYLLLYSIVFFFAGCNKDDISFPVEPKIEYESINPTSVNQYTDPVYIWIRYEDGDGDLGENKDGVKNCFVTDNRIGITYQYRVEQLGPNTSAPVAGKLKIVLGGQVLTDSSAHQSVTYTVYLVDRAGHMSNSVTTSAITINR